jgi:Family of unknown function (DUF6318)
VKKTPVAILAASILLSSCGGGAKPDPSSSTSSPTTSTSAPTASASPTTASPTIDPNIPAAARAHTPAGAAAFVKYFHEQLNVSWRTPKAGLLPPLSLPGCKTCTALDDNAADLVAKHQRVSGDPVRIDAVDVSDTASNGDQRVIITGVQLRTSVVDSNAQKVRDIPAAKIRSVAMTRWTASGWRVSEIKVLA